MICLRSQAVAEGPGQGSGSPTSCSASHGQRRTELGLYTQVQLAVKSILWIRHFRVHVFDIFITVYHLFSVAFSVLQTELIVPLADSTGCHLSSSTCHITQSRSHGSVCPQARDQSLPLSASPEFSIETHTMDGVACIGNC